MLVHPQYDPIAISIGPLDIRWYGLMYLAGFLAGLYLGKWRGRNPARGFSQEQVSDLLFYIVLGIILGGRVGYVLFYNFDQFLSNPLYLLRIWEGGMSFHGGFLGVLVAMYVFGRHNNKAFFTVTDFIAPLIAPGIAFGRLGNYINGELWGRASDMPWAMVFPQAADGIARHPSQLYQFAGEGLILFFGLWWFSRKIRPRMVVSAAFLIGYGCLRTFAEYFREPDAHIGFLAGNFLTMGMLLSIPMVLAGLLMLYLAYRNPIDDSVDPEQLAKQGQSRKKASKPSTKGQKRGSNKVAH